MIAKLSDYTHKELVIKNLRTGEWGKYAIAEDFCKDTQDLRKTLLTYLKAAKASDTDMIKGGFIKYKTLVLIFNSSDGERNIYCHYSLEDIKNDPNWYKQPKVAER